MVYGSMHNMVLKGLLNSLVWFRLYSYTEKLCTAHIRIHMLFISNKSIFRLCDGNTTKIAIYQYCIVFYIHIYVLFTNYIILYIEMVINPNNLLYWSPICCLALHLAILVCSFLAQALVILLLSVLDIDGNLSVRLKLIVIRAFN